MSGADNKPTARDAEEALCDLEGIGQLLLDLAGIAEGEEALNPRVLYFLGTSTLKAKELLWSHVFPEKTKDDAEAGVRS